MRSFDVAANQTGGGLERTGDADRSLSLFVIEAYPCGRIFWRARPREITRQSPLCPDSDQIPQRSGMTICARNRH
jgi:hypothetical protein